MMVWSALQFWWHSTCYLFQANILPYFDVDRYSDMFSRGIFCILPHICSGILSDVFFWRMQCGTFRHVASDKKLWHNIWQFIWHLLAHYLRYFHFKRRSWHFMWEKFWHSLCQKTWQLTYPFSQTYAYNTYIYMCVCVVSALTWTYPKVHWGILLIITV